MNEIWIDAAGPLRVGSTMVAPGDDVVCTLTVLPAVATLLLYGPTGDLICQATTSSDTGDTVTVQIPSDATAGTHTLVATIDGTLRRVAHFEVLPAKSIVTMTAINASIARAYDLLTALEGQSHSAESIAAELYEECATLAGLQCEESAVRFLLDAAHLTENAGNHTETVQIATLALRLLPADGPDELRDRGTALLDSAAYALESIAPQITTNSTTAELVAAATSDTLQLATTKIASVLEEMSERVRLSQPTESPSPDGTGNDPVTFSAQKLLADLLKCGVAFQAAVDTVDDVATTLCDIRNRPITGATIRDRVVEVFYKKERVIGLGWSEWARAYKLQFGDAVPLMLALRNKPLAPLNYSVLRDILVPEHIASLLERPRDEIRPQLTSHDLHHVAHRLLRASRALGLRVVHEETLFHLLRDLAANAPSPWLITADHVSSAVEGDLDAALAAAHHPDGGRSTTFPRMALSLCARAVLTSYRRFLGTDDASLLSRFVNLTTMASNSSSDSPSMKAPVALWQASMAFHEDVRALGLRPLDLARLSSRATSQASIAASDMQELAAMLSVIMQARHALLSGTPTGPVVTSGSPKLDTRHFMNILRRQRRIVVEGEADGIPDAFFAVHSIQELSQRSFDRRVLFVCRGIPDGRRKHLATEAVLSLAKGHPLGHCNTVVFINDRGTVPARTAHMPSEDAGVPHVLAIRSADLHQTYLEGDRQGGLSRVLIGALQSEA